MLGAVQVGLTSCYIRDDKTYAVLSPERKDSNITLSNNNYSAQYSAANWRSVYLDIDKTSGLWSFEIKSSNSMGSNQSVAGGFRSSIITGNYIASSNYGVMDVTWSGNHVYNAVSSLDYWDRRAITNTWYVNVFDFDNRKMYSLKSGILKVSSILSGTGQLYLGISLYGTNVYTINTGYQPFQSGNETLVSSLESYLGVSINRGVWA